MLLPSASSRDSQGQLVVVRLPYRRPTDCCTVMSDYRHALRKHLVQDLYPYTFILADCPIPQVYYSTEVELERHMTTGHVVPILRRRPYLFTHEGCF
jgi:hypothetical protein